LSNNSEAGLGESRRKFGTRPSLISRNLRSHLTLLPARQLPPALLHSFPARLQAGPAHAQRAHVSVMHGCTGVPASPVQGRGGAYSAVKSYARPYAPTTTATTATTADHQKNAAMPGPITGGGHSRPLLSFSFLNALHGIIYFSHGRYTVQDYWDRQNCKPYMVVHYTFSIHSFFQPNHGDPAP
jgi:hypothetical protein